MMPLLCLVEHLLAVACQLYATLEFSQGVVEAEVAGFQLFDQRFQCFKGLFKVRRIVGFFGHDSVFPGAQRH